MGRLTYNKTLATSLLTLRQQKSLTGTLGDKVSVSVPKGTAGTLSLRTSNSVGTVTAVNGNHGIGTGDKFDLYWNGGYRISCVAGTVSGTGIPIASSGAGPSDNLPIQGTVVTVSKQVPFTIALTMDDLLGISFILRYPASVITVPHLASLVLEDLDNSFHTYLTVTPNKGIIVDVLSDGNVRDLTGLSEDTYTSGFVSNPSTKSTGIFKVLYMNPSES